MKVFINEKILHLQEVIVEGLIGSAKQDGLLREYLDSDRTLYIEPFTSSHGPDEWLVTLTSGLTLLISTTQPPAAEIIIPQAAAPSKH